MNLRLRSQGRDERLRPGAAGRVFDQGAVGAIQRLSSATTVLAGG